MPNWFKTKPCMASNFFISSCVGAGTLAIISKNSSCAFKTNRSLGSTMVILLSGTSFGGCLYAVGLYLFVIAADWFVVVDNVEQ